MTKERAIGCIEDILSAIIDNIPEGLDKQNIQGAVKYATKILGGNTEDVNSVDSANSVAMLAVIKILFRRFKKDKAISELEQAIDMAINEINKAEAAR